LAAIYRVGDSRVGQWSELGSRDIDGQTREGEQSGESESMEQAGERDGGRVEKRLEISNYRVSASLGPSSILYQWIPKITD
jgi:hypothetical protein